MKVRTGRENKGDMRGRRVKGSEKGKQEKGSDKKVRGGMH